MNPPLEIPSFRRFALFSLLSSELIFFDFEFEFKFFGLIYTSVRSICFPFSITADFFLLLLCFNVSKVVHSNKRRQWAVERNFFGRIFY